MWLSVDKDGMEAISEDKPERSEVFFFWSSENCVDVPKGTIKRLIGRDLKWEDEAVEVTGYATLGNTFPVTQPS